MSENARQMAVIGTAGRDKSIPMTETLWRSMVEDLRRRVASSDTLVSGGAAWADHLAVHAYLSGWCSGLRLYLPAPLVDGQFQGPFKSAGSAANYYHHLFSEVVGFDSLAQIGFAIARGAHVECEPVAPGVRAMFVRNAKVAKAVNCVVAYTFGGGDEPQDGGTLDTWKQVRGQRTHVRMGDLQGQTRAERFRNRGF